VYIELGWMWFWLGYENDVNFLMFYDVYVYDYVYWNVNV